VVSTAATLLRPEAAEGVNAQGQAGITYGFSGPAFVTCGAGRGRLKARDGRGDSYASAFNAGSATLPFLGSAMLRARPEIQAARLALQANSGNLDRFAGLRFSIRGHSRCGIMARTKPTVSSGRSDPSAVEQAKKKIVAAQYIEAVDRLLQAFQQFASAPTLDFRAGYGTRFPGDDEVEVVAGSIANAVDVQRGVKLRRLYREFRDTIPHGPAVLPLPSSEETRRRRSVQRAVDRIVEFLLETLAFLQKRPGRKRSRRPSKSRKPRPLTVLQTEAVQIVGECKGNIAQAAKRLGKDRKTIAQAYKAGLAKLGKQPVKHGTRTLARDRRGQVDLAEGEDRRV